MGTGRPRRPGHVSGLSNQERARRHHGRRHFAGRRGGAKVFIFSYLIYGAVTGNTSDIDLQRVYVTSARAEEIIEEEGVVDPEDPGFDAKWEEAYGQAQRETERLTDAQVRERCRDYRQQQREEESQLEAGDDSEAAAAMGFAFVGFLKESFSPIDLVFIALAVMSAYKIGSGAAGK